MDGADLFLRFLLVIVSALLVFCVFGLFMSIKATNECNDKGGVYTKYGCLDKKVILK